ncbi:MAG: CpsD/CapB family tyrosine-protein kinase [Pseudomonadota bacterium]
MDRIRQAVLRAREDQPKQTVEQRSAPPAAAAPQRQDAGQFAPVECDFSNFAKNRIISNEQDPVMNAYRILRTRVLQKMEQNNWRTLAVVSPASGAGKSVTAANLAIAIGSKRGSLSTLVDLDFYRPSIARYLGLKNFPSTLDFFEGKKRLQDVTVRPNLPNTLVLANERVTRSGAELLASDKADELIDRTVHEYGSRAVVFDMSPILGCDDTIAFLPKVDCVLLIAASGQTRVPELKEAKRLLGGANVIGTVLNKAPSVLAPNYYYY